MIKKAKDLIYHNLKNIPGWRTTRKIVVFESDDWGSLRMPSLIAYTKLEESGLNLKDADAERFNKNDNLATAEDFENLFDVLSGVKDRNGNNAVFTPVSIVANPDFKKIFESGFESYYYELFTETLKRFKGCERSFEMWKEGIDKNLFVPQLHGREHLNVKLWMDALTRGDDHTLRAFKEGVWGFVPDAYPVIDYQAAFLLREESDLEYYKIQLKEAVKIFKELFGYKACYFVPPNGHFTNSLNKFLIEHDIKFRSAAKIQIETLKSGQKKKRFHYLGQSDRSGIKYITRNCVFEPNQNENDWVDKCLFDIRSAFKWNKPAIINSHRVNYVSSLNVKNRDHGLYQLSNLLKSIVKKWPDVEFMTTAELGKLMDNANE